ncbi:MAG: adenosylcobinamide-GDP ribazoletransferase [Candidatus Binataceae bacterium]
MSVSAPGERSAGTTNLWIAELRLALSFLTILPVAPRRAVPAAVSRSFRWFALAGFMIGAALCVEDWLLGFVFAPTSRSWLTILSLAVVTGGVHLDGLADTADALGAGRNRARALEIMRDSHIGSFGAIALIFVLGLKVAALSALTRPARYAALWLAPGLARWAMVASADGLDYLRPRGAGTSLLGFDRRALMVASLTVVVGALPVLFLPALRAYVVAVAMVLILRTCYRRWLGGITGDLLGATGELVETAVLLAISAR